MVEDLREKLSEEELKARKKIRLKPIPSEDGIHELCFCPTCGYPFKKVTIYNSEYPYDFRTLFPCKKCFQSLNFDEETWNDK